MIITDTEKCNGICEIVRDELKRFPLYNETHQITVVVRNFISVGYESDPSMARHRDTTGFDLNVEDYIGYLLWMCVDRDKRGRGYGRVMLNVIENIFRRLDCKRVQLTASGENKEIFYKKYGFRIREAKSGIPIMVKDLR